VIDEGAEVGIGLCRYGDIVARSLETYLGTASPSDYLTAPLVDYPARVGKSLRPSICLATCEAFGGSIDDAVPTASAIELFHNAFLVHDDIEDQSLFRRGQPTLHRLYGTALALNAGDALALHAMGALRDNVERLGPRLADRVMMEFDFMSRQTVAGQALELGWCRDNRTDLQPDDYLDLVMKKTCWYTTVLPLRTGALIGSHGAANLEPMISFGFHLGAAFQIRDDILNLIGDPDVYGKERFGDLREGKRTLMLIHLLAVADSADRRWLEHYLSGGVSERRPQDVARVFELMVTYGSISFSSEFAAGVARTAEAAMEGAFAGTPDSRARRFITRLVPFMIERAS
jgi:geranylgeranyl diphosphate synthase type II